MLWTISAWATSMICASGKWALFPSTFPFLLTLEARTAGVVTKREIVKCTNRSSDTFTIVRSAGTCPSDDSVSTQTTTAFSFDPSSETVTIKLNPVGEIIEDINDELVRLETAKLPKSGWQMTGLLQEAKSSNIASATTTNLATATGNEVHITGTTTITGLGTVTAGTVIHVIFDGVLTLTHNATSLILPRNGANIITAVWDSAIFVSEGSGNWKCIAFQSISGASGSYLSQSGAEIYGATATGNDTYVVTLSPIPTSYTNGMPIVFKTDVWNTWPATINVNWLGAKTIKKCSTLDLEDGDILAGQVCCIFYDGTNFQLVWGKIDAVWFQELYALSSSGYNLKQITSHPDGISADNCLYLSVWETVNAYLVAYKLQDGFLYEFARSTALAVASGQLRFACVIGDYVYSFQRTASATLRHDKDTLANGTTMTISGTALTDGTPIFSDGTNMYNVYSAGTAKKYTLSGTTFTSSTDTSYTSMVTTRPVWCDGTYVYQPDAIDAGGNCVMYRWALAGWARTTLNSKQIASAVSTTDLWWVKQKGKDVWVRGYSPTASMLRIIPQSSR